MAEISEALKSLRAEHHLSQQGLADALGVTRQSVSNWERGKNLPDIETIVCIAETYGISLDTLILGKDGRSEMKEKLVRDGSEGRRARANFAACLVGAALMCMGAMLWLVKGASVEYIDAEGVLHENFFLLPLGLLFMAAGFVAVVASGIAYLRHRRRISE